MSQFIEMMSHTRTIKKKVGEVAKVMTGSTPSRNHHEYWGGSNYWVSAQDMSSKYVNDTLEKVTDEGFATCKIVPAGSVLYVCRGSIGVISINTIDCATNQSICSATCKDGYDNEFLYYALKFAENDIKKQGTGTSFKSLNQSSFAAIEIDFPSLEVQQSFISIAHQADKSGFVGLKSQFIEMFGTIDKPKFTLNNLGNLCDIQRGGSPRPIKDYITDDADGINWIKIGDTDDSMYIVKTAEKIKPSGLKKTRQVYAGDLLLSNSMSFGRPYILKIDGCIHDGWLVLHIKDKSKLTQIYLCAFLSQKSSYSEMSKLAAGGVVQNLNSKIVKKLPVILPPMEKQFEYISILQQADKSGYGSFKLAS